MERKVIACQKKNILHFFSDKRAIEMADFIATKIEGTGKYYIHKHRGCDANCIYDQDTFFDVVIYSNKSYCFK